MLVHKITDIDGGTLQHADGHSGNDYTLCGLTLDGDSTVINSHEVITGKITCPECIAIIKHCRTLKL